MVEEHGAGSRKRDAEDAADAADVGPARPPPAGEEVQEDEEATVGRVLHKQKKRRCEHIVAADAATLGPPWHVPHP